MDSVFPHIDWEAMPAQIAQRQPEAIALLNTAYHQLFNDSIQQGCGNCYQKAFYRIQKYLYLQQQDNSPNNILNMTHPNRKYLLKPDRSLQTTFGGDTLTNDNLTDSAAEKLLHAFPELLEHFERFPAIHNIVKAVEDVVAVAAPVIEIATQVAKVVAQVKGK